MRILLAAAVIFCFPMSAKTPIPLPDYEAVAKAAEICSAHGAFGRSFARTGSIDATADEDWAPFRKLTLSPNEIHAEASFHGIGGTLEEDIALATDFRLALDKALTAKHVFKARQAHNNGAAFQSSKESASGMSFLLRQEQEVIVGDCIDLDR
jgi:hypothetical protein